ncbi:MAG TPA: ATPase [Bacillus sp. (in: firmicutes)]|nr:ATPase [Bacillus sp. (in: firmicutes)]
MRDVLFLPLDEKEELVIAVDNVGAIGEKEYDDVSVSYDTVAYYSLRVAMMELLSVGATPLSVVISNFNGEGAWPHYKKGIERVCYELNMECLAIVGSSETNFSLTQSAVGFTLIGKVKKGEKKIGRTPADACLAVIGTPLVGPEVLEQQEKILPLSIFQKLLKEQEIYELIPVGSKGIGHELHVLMQLNGFDFSRGNHDLPLEQSAGPATCVLISYNEAREPAIRDLCGDLFRPLTEKRKM